MQGHYSWRRLQLDQMTPHPPSSDHAYQGRGNAKGLGYLRVSSGAVRNSSDLSDLTFGQFGLGMIDALQLIGSSFQHHVAQIFGARAEPKMLRIAARTIVAGMANEQAIGDRSVCKRPRHPMGKLSFSINPKITIPVLPTARSPFPALIRPSFINEVPETARRVYFGGRHSGAPSLGCRGRRADTRRPHPYNMGVA